MAVVFSVLGCYREHDEFEGLPQTFSFGEDPLDFLDIRTNINGNDAVPLESSDVGESAVYFSQDYDTIIQWGTVEFAQKNAVPTIFPRDDTLDLIRRARFATRSENFIPTDTLIGDLEDLQELGGYKRYIYNTIETFFRAMKDGSIQRVLQDLVLQSEIPVINRQIYNSAEYGPDIEEVRVGEIHIQQQDTYTSSVRVIRKGEIESRVELLFYFIQADNQWFINAIEGDFNALRSAYVHPGVFVPLGTTGITQGF